MVYAMTTIAGSSTNNQRERLMPLDAAKIKARRERLKLTQEQAAERAGMPRPHWSRIESGSRDDPNLSTAERVAKALKCPLVRILR